MKPGKAVTTFRGQAVDADSRDGSGGGAAPLLAPAVKTSAKPGKRKGAADASSVEAGAGSRACAGGAAARTHSIFVEIGAQAKDGEANDELIRALAKVLKLPKRACSLVSGHKSREKVVQVGPGIALEELCERLAKEMELL